MKKEYTKPTTEVVELKMNHYLMTGSPYTEDVYEDAFNEQDMEAL